jgi:hypothetical protein
MSVVHLFDLKPEPGRPACCKRCVPQLSFGKRSMIATPTAAGKCHPRFKLCRESDCDR